MKMKTEKINGYNIEIFIDETLYKEIINKIRSQKTIDVETYINNLLKNDLKKK